jgi:hypothetical protein
VRAEWQRAVSAAVLEPGLDLSVTARNGLLVTYSKTQEARSKTPNTERSRPPTVLGAAQNWL